MIGRLMVFALVAAIGLAAVGAAIDDDGGDDLAALDEIELRKDDASPDAELVDDDADDDPTGDRDDTQGDDGTNGGDNTADGDDTGGNDGTGGGDGTGNDASAGSGGDGTLGGGGASYEGDTAAPAAAPAPAPAPAPVYDDYSDDAGEYYDGGSDDGGT
jgi:hypothetical protein